MRILVLIHEYPPVGGGGGRVAQDLCQGLSRRGHELTVLTAHYQGLPFEQVGDGVRVIRLRSWRRQAYKADLLAMTAYLIAGFRSGISLFRRWKPDLIHVHFAVPAGALALALSRLTGVPYVLTAHLGDVPGGVPEKTDRWFRWLYPFTPPIWKGAAAVAAVSEHTRQLAIRHYPVQMHVIPNGVDMDGLDPGEIVVGQPPRIVFAGRFVPQKDPLRVVLTLAELKHLEWKCVLIGDGPLRPTVEGEIKARGLEERFILTGWVEPEKVLQWYRQSDILFMPSLSEGFPVAGVQGLAMGLAIIASGVGGFIDLVQPGENGYLIEPNQPDGYRRALAELLADPQRLYNFRLASRRLAARFDLSNIVQAYEALYRAALVKPKEAGAP